jgi:two-component system, sporulation sensor kinase C
MSADEKLPAGEEAAVTADERWFRAVADYTYDWESWHGPDGQLIWVNPAVERITGYSVADCLAMEEYPLALIIDGDRANISEVLASARNRTSGESVDVRAMHRNGETRWVSLSWQPMYAAAGRYLGFRTSVRDVTERRKLREELRLHAEHLEQLVQERTARLRQLEQRQRQMEKLAALGQLAAGVAHEINNPLAGIRNAFELFKSGLSPQDEHFELLVLIDREIERMSAIVLQMHQLYRRSPSQPSDFSMAQILGEVIRLLESVAKKRRVHLTCDLGSSAANVHLSEGEVKQILYNLIGNALQASPENEAVSVQLYQDAEEVAIHVQDRGAGIPEDTISRVFEPFFTTKHGSDEPGMGLGLSVSRSLIEAMGGRIEVMSSKGEGAKFSAIFPTRVDQTGAAYDE